MKLLFYLSKCYSIPVVDPIIRALSSFPENVSYRLYVSAEVENDMPTHWTRDYVLQNLKEVKSFVPDFVLCPGNHVDFRMPGLKVQLFHGVGVEKDSHFEIRHFFDIYFTSGPYVTRRYEKLQKVHRYFHVLETGWPKFDHLLSLPVSMPKLSNGFKPGMKVILYAPTFSRRLESASQLSAQLLSDLKEDEYLLVKFHDLMPLRLKQSFLNKSMSRVQVIEDTDISRYMHLSDLMISDTSSVVYEFLALKKPVITFRTKAFQEKAYNIEDVTQLREGMDLLLANPDYHLEARMHHLNQVNPYLDGKISHRMLSQLALIKQQEWKPRRKPWNIYRKWQVLYKYYFFRKAFN